MKYVLALFLSIALFSCKGTKQIAENSNKKVEEIVKTEASENTPESKTDDAEIESTIKDKMKTNEKENLEQKEDEITENSSFNQQLTKKIFPVHHLWNELLQEHVSDNGNVNYRGFKKSYQELNNYIKVLQNIYPKLDRLSKDERLAYWINTYNAMTIDLILRHYPINSIKDIKDPWKQRYWKLGDKWYNLDEIEHQIIRKMGEPRIHFALVCAAVSCPKLYNKAFTAVDLEEDLTKLTREFLADPSKNSLSETNLKLSKIFSWFAKDFKQNGNLISFLNEYSDVHISDNAKKRFNTYNWALNE